MTWPQITDADVLMHRGVKNQLHPNIPYAFLVESERSRAGTIDDVLTIFLTNRECPFRCTMCDLWKNTLDERVPVGAIPTQIDYACDRLTSAKHIKLYNAGNFFDAQAIPPEDHPEIANRVRQFETVIVENHPRLTDYRCVRFRDQIETQLEVALGLETIHPTILPSLNKRMSVEDFNVATQFLLKHQIDVRVFLLVKPPGLNEREGIEWSVKSLQLAVNSGATCISLIPTRSGNGMLEQLQQSGQFSPPSILSMESVLEQGLDFAHRMHANTRIFMDLWDVEKFFHCPACGPARSARIHRMNLSQQIEPPIPCAKCQFADSVS